MDERWKEGSEEGWTNWWWVMDGWMDGWRCWRMMDDLMYTLMAQWITDGWMPALSSVVLSPSCQVLTKSYASQCDGAKNNKKIKLLAWKIYIFYFRLPNSPFEILLIVRSLTKVRFFCKLPVQADILSGTSVRELCGTFLRCACLDHVCLAPPTPARMCKREEGIRHVQLPLSGR